MLRITFHIGQRGRCVGRRRAGKATKLMALVDGNGLPISVSIADGNRHGVVLTEQTLDAAFVHQLPPRLIGDKARDSTKHEVLLAQQHELELIAPKRKGQNPSRRKQDGRKLRRAKRRWMVERLFAWLQSFRRLVTRWEYKSEKFLGFLQLGCIVMLLRQFRCSR